MEINTLVTNKELFLKNLKWYMDLKGYSHSDLARIVGFSRQQVGNLFNGDGGINSSTQDKIALALGLKEVSLSQIDFIENYKKKTK